MRWDVVIPACDEGAAIGGVLVGRRVLGDEEGA